MLDGESGEKQHPYCEHRIVLIRRYIEHLELKRGDLLPAGIHYWKMGSTGATQRDGHNRGTNRLGRVKG